MAKKILEINADQFKKEVLEQDLVVVDFYSTECPPCEALATKYEPLSELYGDDIKFLKIFRQENRELAESLDVTGSPTVLFFKNGEKVGKTLSGGIKRSELAEELNALLPERRVKEIQDGIQSKETEADVVILGGGPAGMTAGIYLAQAHLKTIMVDKALPGGYVSTTHQVSNYPGFIDPVQGFMLSHFMSEQAKQNGVEFRSAVDVTDVDLENRNVWVDGVEKIRAKKIILATGSSPRPLNIPGEKEYQGQGISYCATCDAKYFEDKEVVVIGGGNSAIEESLFIAKFAKKITIVHQFDDLHVNKEGEARIKAEPKAEILFSHEPREFKKYGTMDMGVVVEDLKTGRTREIKTNGIFVFVGFVPNTGDFGNKMKLDQWGYIETNEEMESSLKNVYAVGDLRSKNYRQITTAVSDGTIAAMSISKELN